MKQRYWKNWKEGLVFLETMSHETVYMTSGSQDSAKAGSDRIKEAIKLIRLEIRNKL